MSLKRRSSTSSRRSARSNVPREPWHVRLVAKSTSDPARFVTLACFALLVALTGGGSRPDIQSLIVLRPAAVLFCTYALLVATTEQLREVRTPLTIVVALMVLALLQLVPLPPALWSQLPQGDLIMQASNLAGIGVSNRPLSLDPARTWNTFFALFVPLATICLVAIQAPKFRRLIVPTMIAIALLSAVFGMLQAVGGERLHLYAITHAGYPVGLFANKNHQAVLMLWLMLAGSWLAASIDTKRSSPSVTVGGAIALILVLFTLVILTGSRAGLALSGPVLVLCGWLLLRAPSIKSLLQRAGIRKSKLLIAGVAAILAIPLIFVLSVLLASSRQTALSRLFSSDPADDLRWSILPVALRMTSDFFPLGSGFGSFERLFKLYEPSQMLASQYVNQAHNDFVQLVLEGGLPAVVLMAVAIFWVIRLVWRAWSASRSKGRDLAIFIGGSIALWSAASIVDYPLRTPLVAMLLASLTAWVSTLSSARVLSSAGSHQQKDAD